MIEPHLITQILYLCLFIAIKQNEDFVITFDSISQVLGLTQSQETYRQLTQLEYTILVANQFRL